MSRIKTSHTLFRLSLTVLLIGIALLTVRIYRKGSSIDTFAAGASSQKSGTQKIAFWDIEHAYHGQLLDKNYNEIKLNRAVIEQIQDSMIDALTAQPITTEYKVEGPVTFKPQITKPPLEKAYVEKVLQGFKFSEDERVVMKSIVIQQGIDASPSQEQGELQWRLNLINERSIIHLNPKVWTTPQSEFENYLTRINLRDVVERIRVRLRPDPSYQDVCRLNQVPIPPDWPTGGWRKLEPDLPCRYNFLRKGPATQVWVYEPPNLPSGDPPPDQGVCYALPRIGSVPLLVGIICQSKRTGKACFWDNIHIDAVRDPVTGWPRLEGKDLVLPISELKNGNNLAENCTGCHLGSNAFLIHPETVLGAPPNRNPDLRYTPISNQSGWLNPLPLAALGTGACSSCHEVGEPTPSYCRIVAQAADLTMPNSRWPALWSPTSTTAVPAAGTAEYAAYMAYRAHIAFLKTRCFEPPRPTDDRCE